MEVYYSLYALIFVIAIIAYLLYDNNKVNRKKFICFTSFLFLFLLLALRHQSMGIDMNYREATGYLGSFDIINSMSWKQVLRLDTYLNYEKGYIIFNKFVGSVYNNRNFFMGVCAFINILPIAIYVYYKSKLPVMSVIIFLALPTFLMYFSGLRQGIAISLTLCSLYFIENKKKLFFALTVFLASLFHYSALIFIIAYPMYYMKLTNVKRVFLPITVFAVYLLKYPLFNILGKFFKDDAAANEMATGGTLFFIFLLMYIFMLFFYRKSEKKENDHINGAINLFYVACICQSFSSIYDTAMRVGYYFMIYLIIALPNTIAKFEKKEKTIIYMIIVVLFMMFGIRNFSSVDSFAKTNPYVFFWK